MSLRQNVLPMINTRKTRLKLAGALEVTEQTIMNYIKTNSDCLTKYVALKIISDDTGLSQKELLDEKLLIK